MRYLAYVAAGYAALVAAAFFMANSLTFYPRRDLIATPSEQGLPWEDVSFQAGDGTPLHGWFIPGGERGTLLFFHGNAGNISHRLDSLEIFHKLGLSVFIFDYRGYGKSEGRTTEAGIYSDAEGAWHYLTEVRALPPEEIVVFGRSLGGAVAAWAAEKYRPAGAILESTFTSLADAGKRHFFFLPVGLIVGDSFNTLARIGRIRCPLLLASSPDDEIVPGEHGRILYDAAPEPKWFLPLRGDHNWGFIYTGEAYAEGLDAFFSEIFRASEAENEVE